MKFNFVLGTCAIVVLSACSQRVGAPGAVDDEHGTSDGNGYAGAGSGDDTSDAGTPRSDGGEVSDSPRDSDAGADASDDGDHSGTKHHDRGAAGASSGSPDSDAAGTPKPGDAGEGGASNSNADDAGSPNSDQHGEAGASDGDDGENSGSGGHSGTGGSGGLAASGGVGGLAASGGVAGLPASGGSAGVDASGGAGGTAGLPATGGNGGVAESGGSSGTSGSAGSGAVAGSGSVSLDPEYLFTTETFGGNGRTCTTCHSIATGTISPAEVQALYSSNPESPLFRPIDSDDGASTTYTDLQARATFRVSIDLPPGVSLVSDASATSIVVRRGAPTTINSPALDSVIMWDGREPTLTDQALSAILGHSQATVTPTSDQLDLIAQFEKGFFSSDVLRQYAQGGAAPTWPDGTTDAEQRGRRWFAPDSAAPRFNICGQCHGGPMANETQSNSGLPAGKHFQTVNVSEFNTLGNPTYTFKFPDPSHPGQTVTVTTPDPGRALITGDVRDLNFFKIPTLWGVKNTAPYFHDNSALTLEELLDHYEKHLATFLPRNATYPRPHVPTAEDKADIIAYLKLL